MTAIFPTADQIAIAVVAASRLFGADPIKVVQGALSKPGAPIPESRARPVATEALRLRFPDARKDGIFRCLGWPAPHGAIVALRTAKTTKWWSDDLVDEVLGALIPDDDDLVSAAPKKATAPLPVRSVDCAYCGCKTRAQVTAAPPLDGGYLRESLVCGCAKQRRWKRTVVREI
jgi:hypothetical protein